LSTAKQDVAADVVIGRESLLFDLIHRVSYFEKHYFYPRESFEVKTNNKQFGKIIMK